MSLRTFTQAYIEALYFTNSGDSEDDLESLTADTPLSFSALRRILGDCKAFYSQHNETINADGACLYGGCPPDEYAGHDFWLTRNGHGCGFWDGDWAEPQASVLDTAAKAFGEIWPYKGDDGKVYL